MGYPQNIKSCLLRNYQLPTSLCLFHHPEEIISCRVTSVPEIYLFPQFLFILFHCHNDQEHTLVLAQAPGEPGAGKPEHVSTVYRRQRKWFLHSLPSPVPGRRLRVQPRHCEGQRGGMWMLHRQLGPPLQSRHPEKGHLLFYARHSKIHCFIAFI